MRHQTTPLVPPTRPRSRAVWIRLIVAFDFLLLLAPPLHWAFATAGDPLSSLGYLVGGSALVVLSLPALLALTAKEA